MPAAHNPIYRRPSLLFSSHLETIYPALFRRVKIPLTSFRERIDTPDGDFLDLDWYRQGSAKLVIIQHGLEGSSDRPYVRGMARAFLKAGFDALCWNFRGCSGEMNRKSIFYHSGATYDLNTVVKHASILYKDISLVGFSLGANLTLKYLGEKTPPPTVKRAVAISVPLDLDSCARQLSTPRGQIYERRFLANLLRKVKEKAQKMPESIPLSPMSKVKTLRDFDDYFTAPLHGFEDALHYYTECSSRYFLEAIRTPTLVLNALNDPLLTPQCTDHQLAANLSWVHLETTDQGGHVGYAAPGGTYWSEARAVSFCVKTPPNLAE